MVVRSGNDRYTNLLAECAQKIDYLLSRDQIQVGSGFIGQDDGRFVRQGPIHGHTLLLPTGHFIGPVSKTMAKSHRRHSSIHNLPDEVQEQVNRLLTRPGHTYQDIVDFIREQGFQVSHSSVGRYGKDFLARLERLNVIKEQAQTIVADAGDRPATEMAEAANQLAVQLIMEHLMSVDELEGAKVTEVLKALALLEKSATGRERLKLEFREKARKVAEQVGKSLEKEDISHETIRKIKENIYGIVT